VSNTWLTHVHLHFSAIARERSRSEDSRAALLPAVVTREIRRLVTSRHWTTIRTVASQSRSSFHTTTHVFPATSAAVLKVHVPATSVRQARLPWPIVPRVADRRVRPLFDRSTRNVFRAVVSKSELTQRIERETSMVSRELRLIHSRTSVTRHLQEESTVRVHRPPEIVWRTASQPQTQTQIINEGPLPGPRMSRPAVAAQESTPEIPRRAARAALQATDLDPALLDRLTDDVIRRVERRVRIERERRGL
jgi:hypothetical protein